MIEPKVKQLVEVFTGNWSQWVERQPLLALDGTWPSIGVLDQLTFGLRGAREVGAVGRQLLQASAGYIGIIAHDAWTAFGAQPELGIDEKGVFIIARGSGTSGERDARINIEQQLEKLLLSPPRSFPVIADFTRNVGLDQDFLGLFSLGVVTGMSPFGEGAWLTESLESFQPNIDKVVRVLAAQCATHYGRIFPDEQLGQVAELYLGQLIYPPLLMGEELPACRASSGLLSFGKEYGLKTASLLRLSRNLALSPNDQISHAGLVVYAALSEGELPPEVVAVAESKGGYTGLLRKAMLGVRDELGLPKDWLSSTNFDDDQAKRYDVEMALGLLPWIKLPKRRMREKVKNERLVKLMVALGLFDLPEAVSLADEILAQQPGDIEVRIQRVYLDVLAGDFEAADRGFKSVLSEPGSETQPMLFNLWGLCDLARGKTDLAERHFEQAYKLGNAETVLAYQAANNYAWALILNEKHNDALELLDKVIEGVLCPVTGLLNKAYVLRMLKRPVEATAVQEQLLKLYPLDRRVFGNLLLEQSGK